MATATKAILALYGDDALRFDEVALQAELRYEPTVQKPLLARRLHARHFLLLAGLITIERWKC